MMSEIFAVQEILDVLFKAVVTALGGVITGGVIVWSKGVIRKNKGYNAALKALAHDSFHRQCRKLLLQETITEDDLENLNYLHDAYRSLGLNGTGEELYKRCLKKPIE